MVVCVYMNPTIDKTVYMERFVFGGTNRPYRVVTDGAGKAINVAVVLRALGADAKVMGVLYNADGEIIRGRLEEHSVLYDFVELDGISRTNTKVFDGATKTVTEINECGLEISPDTLGRVEDSILGAAGGDDIAVLTGSLPMGCNVDFYAGMITALNEKGVRCVLDADGKALKQAIHSKPYMVKPNVDELAVITGQKARTVDEIKSQCRELLDMGIAVVAVSMGSEGAILCANGNTYMAEPVDVDVLSTVGAGDSMVAGIVANIDEPPEEALRAGVAAATASVTLEGTTLCTAALYEEYHHAVKIHKI